MNKKTIFGIIFVLMFSIFIVGCSEKSDAEEPEDKDKNEVKEVADEKAVADDEAEEEESAVPEDEELFDMLETNIQTMQEKDIDAYMETIHPDSPAYDSTKDLMDQMDVYELDVDISNLNVEDKSEDEATVSFTQKSVKIDGPDYQNNEIEGVHTLKPDDGVWKVFNTDVTEQTALDEDGEVMEEPAEADGEVAMEGEYADILTDLEMPFGEDWVLVDYQEADGEGIAEFTGMDEKQDSLALHYVEDGEELIGAEGFIDAMEENLTELVTGKFDFNKKDVTDKEGLYDFSIKDDDIEFDQEEIGRAFVQDGDLFVIRYTLLDETIDDKDEWFDKFKQVK